MVTKEKLTGFDSPKEKAAMSAFLIMANMSKLFFTFPVMF